MEKRMKTKGSAHLEMVVAFTLFIVFTIFLLYYLKAPGEDRIISETILNELESSFLNETTTELISFIVKPNESGCVKFDLSNFSLISGGSSAVVLGEVKEGWVNVGGVIKWGVLDDGRRSSNFAGNILTLNASEVNISENESVRVFVSPAVSSGSICSPANWSSDIGTITREKVLSEIKVSEFNNNYSTNYLLLKSALGLPDNVDFAVESGNFLNATRNKPSVNINSRRIAVNLVFPNGTITKKNIDLSVW